MAQVASAASFAASDQFLRHYLAPGVMTEEIRGIGERLVAIDNIGAIEDHGRGRGIDQPGDTLLPAGLQDILRALHIDGKIVLPFPPDAGQGRDMKDRVDPGETLLQEAVIADIALQAVRAQVGDLGVVMAADHPTG